MNSPVLVGEATLPKGDTFEVEVTSEEEFILGLGDYLFVKSNYEEIEWTLAQIEEKIGKNGKHILKCRILAPLKDDGCLSEKPKSYKNWLRTPFEDKATVIDPESKLLICLFENKVNNRDPEIPLKIGELKDRSEHIPVVLDGKKMNYHTCLLAQSGSGKSYALGLLLEELFLKAEAQILMIDPNSDLKYFEIVEELENINESTKETKKNKCKLLRIQDRENFINTFKLLKIYSFEKDKTKEVQISDDNSINVKLALDFSDLDVSERKALLHIDSKIDHDIAIALNACSSFVDWEKPGNYTLEEFKVSVAVMIKRLFKEDPKTIESLQTFVNLFGSTRGLAYACARLLNRLSELPKNVWRDTTDVDSFLVFLEKNHNGHFIHLDLGKLSPDERGIIALKALEKVMKRNVNKKNNGELPMPTFIVIDEAHNIVPAKTEDPWQRLSCDKLIQIAGEGRKYGLFLILVSQSPSKINLNALTQCSNIIVMKLTNANDLNTIKESFGVKSDKLIESVTRFDTGKALIFGEIVPCPVMVRIGRRRTKEFGPNLELKKRNF